MIRPVQNVTNRLTYLTTPWEIRKPGWKPDPRGTTVVDFGEVNAKKIAEAKAASIKYGKRLAKVELGLWRSLLRQKNLDYRESVRCFAQIRQLTKELGISHKKEETLHRRRMLIHSLQVTFLTQKEYGLKYPDRWKLKSILSVRATLKRKRINPKLIGITAAELNVLIEEIRSAVLKVEADRKAELDRLYP